MPLISSKQLDQHVQSKIKQQQQQQQQLQSQPQAAAAAVTQQPVCSPWIDRKSEGARRSGSQQHCAPAPSPDSQAGDIAASIDLHSNNAGWRQEQQRQQQQQWQQRQEEQEQQEQPEDLTEEEVDGEV